MTPNFFRFILPLALALVLLLGWVYGGAAWDEPFLLVPGNPTPEPAPNDHTVPITSAVSISYDEEIHPASVNSQTFAVHAMQTGWLTEIYSVNGGQITLTPSQPFKAGELVQASATTHLLSLIDGSRPITPTVWQFRTTVTEGTGIFSDNGQNLGNSSSVRVALGDLDKDGDLDAFIGNNQANKVWLNDGTGHFTDSGQSLGNSINRGVALGDLDRDGDLDAFMVNHFDQPNKVWLNNGLGIFTDSGQNLGASASVDLALGDVDGDGDLDAFVANNHAQANKLWLNNGSGYFSDSGQSLGNLYSQSVGLGDLDGDGDLDAFIVNGKWTDVGLPNKIWRNDGTGNFSDSGQSLGNLASYNVALGDVDGDGDLDAFVTNWFDQANKLWLNDGTSHFSDSGQSLGSSSSWEVVLGDLDGDSDLDAFFVDSIWPDVSQPNQIWLNDGAGSFTDSGQDLGNSDSNAVALGDLDGDGDLDGFVANGIWPDVGQANKVWLNQNQVEAVAPAPNTHTAALTSNLTVTIHSAVDQTSVTTQTVVVHSGWQGQLNGPFSVGNGIIFDPNRHFHPGELVEASVTTEVVAGSVSLVGPYVWRFRTGVAGGSGTFSDSGESLGSSASRVVALGDVDGDGDLDAFVANTNGQANSVWLNNGSADFTDSGQSLGSSYSYDVALGDVDGDGDLDAFVANSGVQANKVWLNDGSGGFSASQSLGNSNSYAVTLGDMDGDGDLDAFVGNFGQADHLWLNDGTGSFSDSGQSFGSSLSASVVSGDVDKDGDLDLLVANQNHQANNVWLNNGTGTLYEGQNFGTSDSSAVTLGDLDGDNDLDAFIANEGGTANEVWLNDGTGVFTDSTQTLGNSDSSGVMLGDLDMDGDLDAFVVNQNHQANNVWFNDGTGTLYEGQSLGSSWSASAALGDLDGDGDLDAFISNLEGQANRVWLNQDQGGPTPTPTLTPTPTNIPTNTPTITSTHDPSITNTPTPTPTNTPTLTPTGTPTIKDVRISNLGDVLFTVSWLTNQATTGEVRYGTEPNNLNQTAYDTRGMNTIAETHYVSVENLLPNTTYYFEVVSGGVSSDGSPHQITTAPTLALPGLDTVFGQVLKADGSTLATGTIVYITLQDGNEAGSSGQAAPLSALVDQDGYWVANLAQARLTDLTSYFTYTASGDQLQLEAQGEGMATKCQTVDTVNDSPAPAILLDDVRCVVSWTIYLEQGWNKIAWPLEPLTPTNASTVCEQIAAQGGSIAEIAQWQGGGWLGHICGYPFQNFTLELGRGYFIKTNTPSTWTIQGTLVNEAVPLSFQAGWNSISVPHTEGLTAEALCDQMISQGVAAIEIDRWHTGGWFGHRCGLSFNDFAIERGKGYFVKSSSAGNVTPSAAQPLTPISPPFPSPPNPLSPGERGNGGEGGAVREVRVSNLRDTSVTISWTTAFPSPPNRWRVSLRERGNQALFLPLSLGERGQGGEGKVVVLDSLAAESTYHFEIMSGSQVAYTGSITTTASLEKIPASDTIYGQIFEADGITPATNALVYLTLQDADGAGSAGEASLLSAVVDEEGYWHANLGNARSTLNNQPFIYSQTGDIVIMTVQQGTGHPITQTQDVEQLRPAPPLILAERETWQIYLPMIGQ